MTQEEQLTTADDVDIAGRGPRPRGPLLERIAPSHIDWRSIVLVPLLAVFTALVIGALIIVFTEGPDDVLPAYLALFRGAFVGIKAISETLTAAAPLILAGLSAALGVRAGLFHIGVAGQLTRGGLTGG